jgi:hypothetical protein
LQLFSSNRKDTVTNILRIKLSPDQVLKSVSDIFLLASKIIEKLKPLGNSNEEDKESNEPDYDEDKDQLEEEQKDKILEIRSTSNQVF